MKVSEQLEWNYEHTYDGALTEKRQIPQCVAAELFIHIVGELYDNNIFTHWSGLQGNAHIRIALDVLSENNLKKALEYCKTNKNWKLIKPFYKGKDDNKTNYSIEISADYIENQTEVMEVIDKLQQEIRKLDYQDVEIAPDDLARSSNCSRFSFKGIYELSKNYAYVDGEEKLVDDDCPKDIHEAIEMYCIGNTPEFYYDETSQTFFKSRELLGKSLKYRQKQRETKDNNVEYK